MGDSLRDNPGERHYTDPDSSCYDAVGVQSYRHSIDKTRP